MRRKEILVVLYPKREVSQEMTKMMGNVADYVDVWMCKWERA